MRLHSIDNNEMDPVTILGMQHFSGSDPLPEWWSGEGPEYHHHRLFRKELREPVFRSVHVPQCEVDRLFTNLQTNIIRITTARRLSGITVPQ